MYRDRRGASKEAFEVIEPLKDRLFPKTFEYCYNNREPDGEDLSCEGHVCRRVLFLGGRG